MLQKLRTDWIVLVTGLVIGIVFALTCWLLNHMSNENAAIEEKRRTREANLYNDVDVLKWKVKSLEAKVK